MSAHNSEGGKNDRAEQHGVVEYVRRLVVFVEQAVEINDSGRRALSCEF